MDKQTLRQLLIENGYPARMIDKTVEKIEQFQPEIRGSFNDWVSSGVEPDIEIQGYSFSQLRRDYGMKAIGAFITLDWLIRDSGSATRSLKRGIR